MFQKAELERLRQHRESLVAQSEAQRKQLAEDWRRISSGDFWMSEIHGIVRRHPAATAAMAAVGGIFISKLFRGRGQGGVFGMLGGLGRIASMATNVWRFFRQQNGGGES